MHPGQQKSVPKRIGNRQPRTFYVAALNVEIHWILNKATHSEG
jgi:hypothetical protein